MGRLEKLAYSRGASDEEFMERAGEALASSIASMMARLHLKPLITLLCGPGNNAGDAFVAGRILLGGEFSVEAFTLAPVAKSSPLALLKKKEFGQRGGHIIEIKSEEEIDFSKSELIVDAIFGTGFRGMPEGLFKAAIDRANRSEVPIIAVDIPSGLSGNSGEGAASSIKADETACLGLAKTGFFLSGAWEQVGRLQILDFGLPKEIEAEANADFYLIDTKSFNLPVIKRCRHKYDAGYLLAIGGSKEMSGAMMLASKATLRSGAGMVRIFHPEGVESALVSASHEVIKEGYSRGNTERIFAELERAKALFVGPGMLVDEAGEELLRELFAKANKPMVIDAGALALVAKANLKPPKESILTPHHGEMQRLLGIKERLSQLELNQKTQEYVDKTGCTLVLKGAPTFVFAPLQKPLIMARGTPGMATAGSGDVLTGIITSLLAQGKSLLDAAGLGALLHALSGEIGAKEKGDYSLIASDLIDKLPEAFKLLSDR